jgi:delta-aminolevulinic acid dehydratase/porphobilinogen synthase
MAFLNTAWDVCGPQRACAAWCGKRTWIGGPHPALFVCPGEGVKKKSELCGNYQMSIDVLLGECAEVGSAGRRPRYLVRHPEKKDELASGAYDDQGIVQRAVRAIKRTVQSWWS